ncbi:MAG: biotin transporter BioY [Acidobacteriota bacterium]
MQARAKQLTLIDTFIELDFTNARLAALLRSIVLILGFSMLIALSARVIIPLPFTPVPITAQTFAILVTGALLGPRLGVAAVIAYLLEGALGLPVFQNGNGGLLYMTGPTGGYLFGFLISAAITGWFATRGFDRRFSTAVVTMALAEISLYVCGLSWLAYFLPQERLLELGLLPFLPGDIIKIALAAAVLPTGWRLLGRRSTRSAN